jgi:uncharacterized protein
MPVSASTLLEVVAQHHDMVLQTRKRDGSWIATAVNPLVEGDHVYFRTWQTSGKAKRLRNCAEVRFAPSTASGRPIGSWLRGRARLLDGNEAVHAADLISRRYPLLQGIVVRVYHRLRGYRTLHYRIGDITSDLADSPTRHQ